MLVCKQWYLAVKNNPSLWTSCTFREESTHPQLRKYLAWTLRSGSLPLQVELKYRSGAGLRLLWSRYAKPSFSRLSAVSLIGRFPPQQNNGFEDKMNLLIEDLANLPCLTYLFLRKFDFPNGGLRGGQPLRLQNLRSLIVDSCDELPFIIAPALRELRLLNWTNTDAEYLWNMIKGAAHISEVTCQHVLLQNTLPTVDLPKISLDKLAIYPATREKAENILISQLQLSLLRSCRDNSLTSLELRVPGIKSAKSIPINVFKSLRSLCLEIDFIPSSTVRMGIFASQIQTWLENSSGLEVLSLNCRGSTMPLDIMLVPLLPSTEVGSKKSACIGLTSLVLNDGTLYFPEVIHKIFTDRNNSQRTGPPFVASISGTIVRNMSSEDDIILRPNSMDLKTFIFTSDIEAGYVELEGFFAMDCKKKQTDFLCTLLDPHIKKSEYGCSDVDGEVED